MKSSGSPRASLRLCLFALVLAASSPSLAVSGEPAACVGMVIEIESGAQLDEGWAGTAHDQVFSTGSATSWAVLKRCSNNQAACTSDDDCGGGSCDATCDCGSDPSCELTGPLRRQCLNTMADCTTNADCPSSVACVPYLGPPLPVSYVDTPLCVLTHFEGAASGTFESDTGELSLSANLRRRYALGNSSAQPCPRCGAPDQNPQVGGEFVCEGGQFPGAPCTVEGVTPIFGGTSSDCPPTAGSFVNPSGVLFPLRDLGTGTKSKTARLQCGNASFVANPLSPDTNPRCTDDLAGAVCASNTDCRRCSGDPTIKCTNNGNCTGNGTCVEAPEQPVTCGFWCHCGFCNNNGSSPCFDDGDCAEGQTCQKGTGTSTQSNAAQSKPNNCTQDSNICGMDGDELCASTPAGSCSLQPYRTCTSDATCINNGAGTCILGDRACFESEISRTGSASPLGSYCAVEDKACSTNGDCTFGGDFCVADSTRAEMVALYCLPATSSSPVNSVVGFTGPAAATLPAFGKVCRCTGNETGCEEVCAGGGTGECGNAIVEGGEECDGGACCAGDCTLRSTTTACRGAAGSCDVEESCNGSSAACPADTFAATSVVCRAAVGQCDKSESCSGSAAACPADLAQEDGFACDDGIACTTDQCIGGSCQGTETPECEGICGDGTVDSGEACDDGNATFTAGEYCGAGCVLIPCGRPTNSAGPLPKSSDALFVLRAAVQQTLCHPRVCSPDGNQSVLSSDALRILRAAVGQDVSLACPSE